MGHPTSRFLTTDDALKLFFPVTKSVVVIAKPDSGDPEQVVIKIHDPRYVDERISMKPGRRSYPWNLVTEQAAAIERTKNPDLSRQELSRIMYSHHPEDLSGKDLATHNLFWEENYYRLTMECYESELTAYERLKDLQGSAIPRLIMAGQFLPPDERAIRPPALVLEYIPSVSLYDVPFDAITPAIREQVLSAIKSFPLYGVLHNDITLTNIHFTPPEKPIKGVVLDFGLARIRHDGDTEDAWTDNGASDAGWARRLLEDKDKVFRRPSDEGHISRFT